MQVMHLRKEGNESQARFSCALLVFSKLHIGGTVCGRGCIGCRKFPELAEVRRPPLKRGCLTLA